ncbi:MAG TPA: hypothetical protein VGS19_08550 [Streptosporangiaceae bacterium]|nr:hypothetical protein [Streptosporangiaceae bacterium]
MSEQGLVELGQSGQAFSRADVARGQGGAQVLAGKLANCQRRHLGRHGRQPRCGAVVAAELVVDLFPGGRGEVLEQPGPLDLRGRLPRGHGRRQRGLPAQQFGHNRQRLNLTDPVPPADVPNQVRRQRPPDLGVEP